MKAFFLLALILSLCVSSSCSFFRKDPIILQVNSYKLTSRQFAKRLARKIHSLNIQDVQNHQFMENLKRQLVTDLIIEFLIHQWAKTHSISVSEIEINQALQKIKHKYPNDEIFNLYLKRKKTTINEWKEYIKKTLLSEKVMKKIGSAAKPPSLKEVQGYYQNNSNLFKKNPRILIYHIFHKEKAVLIKIQELLKQGESLEKAVEKFIKNPQITKPQWIEKGILKIFDQAFSLKKNEISPIWSSSYAYHIIQVLDKKPAQQMAFDKVKQKINQKLLAQRQKALFAKWLDEQSKKINVLKNEAALKKIKVNLL